jgi:GDP-L-fucose synthase
MVGGGLVTFFSNKRVVITGSSGFLGSNLIGMIKENNMDRDIDLSLPRSKDYDLRKLDAAISVTRGAEVVINLAANVGGIGYNLNNPGKLFYDNIMIGVNMIEAARINDVKKLVLIGTVCSYPKFTKTPFKEEDLWNGYPEETNAPYGIAKKSLIVMSDAYKKQYGLNSINLLIVNLYGPGDNFDPKSSHVIPAMIRKYLEAKRNNSRTVKLWGTGNASREFLYVKDAARGIILATERYNETSPINLGSGQEIKIKDLAKIISNLVGFEGETEWDSSMPDGQPSRRLDTSLAFKEFQFRSTTPFENGLKEVIEWYSNSFV